MCSCHMRDMQVHTITYIIHIYIYMKISTCETCKCKRVLSLFDPLAIEWNAIRNLHPLPRNGSLHQADQVGFPVDWLLGKKGLPST